MDEHSPERWFLARGLPAVLTLEGRSHHLLSRMAPALAAYATVVLALLVVHSLLGTSEIYIDGAPTPAEQVVLVLLVLVVPVAVWAARWVAGLRDHRKQAVAAVASIVVSAVADLIQGGLWDLLTTGVVVVLIALVTASGAGAVTGWAVRLTMTQAAAMGGLFVRALPVMLLTVVVFFNSYVWQMAASIGRDRLWVALGFLFLVTSAFLVSASRTRVKSMLASIAVSRDSSQRLDGTPFADLPDPPGEPPLTRGERLNVIAVLAAAQIAHLMMVAICTSAIYFVLGLIVLSPEVLDKWTGGGSSDGTVLGMTIPVPQSLIHMTLVLISLTFMYVSARSVGDDEYKQDFLNPLVEDLHTTLLARNRYRG